MHNNKRYERYQRQILLKEFGIEAQQKLLQAKVLVIGAGGLGCPALQYLAAAGVGTIGIVDDDVVSITNLHRQVLYTVDDISLSKAETAAKRLNALNDEITINVHSIRLTNKNALSIIEDYHLVIDGTDNFSSRYMINDACVLLNKPLIYGAVSKFEGQVAVFNFNNSKITRALNYRDLFPNPPKDNEVLNCAEAGVLGVLPGIVGTMQANETIKLITGIGKTLAGKILVYNALDNSTHEFSLSLCDSTQNLIPGNTDAFFNMNYDWLCASQAGKEFEISIEQFDNLITNNNAVIIDVREKHEEPFVNEFKHLQLSLNELTACNPVIDQEHIVLFCQSGKRSLQAARFLKSVFGNKKVYSLSGGITEWKKTHAIEVN